MIEKSCPSCGRNLPDGAHGPLDTVTDLMLAGFGRRVGQFFADQLVLIIPVSLIVAIFDEIGGNFLGGLAGFILSALYFFKFTSSPGGQTVGNRVVASRIRDAQTGSVVGIKKAAQRSLVLMFYGVGMFALPRPLFYVVILIGLLDAFYSLFDKRKQTLHDKLLGTIVVVA